MYDNIIIAAIKGLKRDEKTGLYYYTGTEADDTLRQLKQLKALRKKYKGDEEKNQLEYHTAFYDEFVKNYWIEDMYDERKKELKKK